MVSSCYYFPYSSYKQLFPSPPSPLLSERKPNPANSHCYRETKKCKHLRPEVFSDCSTALTTEPSSINATQTSQNEKRLHIKDERKPLCFLLDFSLVCVMCPPEKSLWMRCYYSNNNILDWVNSWNYCTRQNESSDQADLRLFYCTVVYTSLPPPSVYDPAAVPSACLGRSLSLCLLSFSICCSSSILHKKIVLLIKK